MAKFLVVDDEKHTVTALRELLQDDGHEVSAFTRSEDAVNALCRHPFDAVLTDLDMPHVPGHEVVRTARQRHPAACVFVTSGGRRELVVLPEACHIFDKPLDYQHVVRAVAECRARGGPGRHGQCYMRQRHGQ